MLAVNFDSTSEEATNKHVAHRHVHPAITPAQYSTTIWDGTTCNVFVVTSLR